MILAYKELGLVTTLKFVVFKFIQLVYSLLLFSPTRIMYLQLFGAKVGVNSILMNVQFSNWHRKGLKGLSIGNECYLGEETLLDLYGPVTLGNQVTIAQRVTILTHTNVGYKNHPLQKYFPKIVAAVTIKNGTFIGASSTILPGITIGEKSFIAAGSVVTKNVPPKTLVAGVPATEVRKIR